MRNVGVTDGDVGRNWRITRNGTQSAVGRSVSPHRTDTTVRATAFFRQTCLGLTAASDGSRNVGLFAVQLPDAAAGSIK